MADVPIAGDDSEPPVLQPGRVDEEINKTTADDDGIEREIDTDNHDGQADDFAEAAEEAGPSRMSSSMVTNICCLPSLNC